MANYTMLLVSMLTVLCVSVPDSLAKSVSHHVSHKRLKHARIKAIKTEILDKLDYSEEPEVGKGHVSVEEQRRMVRLYKKSLEETGDQHHILYAEEEFYAKTFYSFSDPGMPPPSTEERDWQRSGAQLIYLPVDIPHPQEALKETVIRSAHLQLFKYRVLPEAARRDFSIVDNAVRVNVYQLLEPSSHAAATKKTLVDSQWVPLDGPGVVSFDIVTAVQFWIDNPAENFGLELSCDTQAMTDVLEFATNSSAATMAGMYLSSDVAPSVNILAQERSILGRQKRAATLDRHDCVRGDGESRCCRYPLWVNFTEIGEDWIIAPQGYQAYYCDGECPHNYRAAHEFAKVKSLLHALNPDAAPAPCCTATELSPLNILHYNSRGSMQVTELSDMVVQNCGCA